MELLRVSKAARRLDARPTTLRQWAVDGKIPFSWIGRERPFSSLDVENMSAAARKRLLTAIGLCAGTQDRCA